MNNIELTHLKRDMKKYLGYSDEELDSLGALSDRKLSSIKRDIEKVKKKTENSNVNMRYRKLTEQRINGIVEKKPKFKEVFGRTEEQKKQEKKSKPNNLNTPQQKNLKKEVIKESKPVTVKTGTKPKILFISDVKGWAWHIKSEYLKKHLDEYYNVEVVCVLGPDSTPTSMIDQKKYDLYFTFGFSYIDFLYKVPKNKKVTGVTAHRRRNVIAPKMKMAGWHHANSILLLKELHKMGYKRAFYVPNGVDTDLFRPINPLKESGELIAGHVGKDCIAKGQRECIFPAIKTTGVKSYTNTKNWKNKIPHKEMVHEYNKMDLMLCASNEDGTPNPCLESAACGRPIISNHIGNMPELIEDGYNGFLVSKSVGEYVNKINYFKNNREELVRMGKNARKSIEKWDWKYMSRNYLKMFDVIFNIKRDKSKYDNIGLSHLEKL